MKILFILMIFVLFHAQSSSQTWKVEGTMPIPVSGAKAIVKDSLIYVLGGFSSSLNRYLNIIQAYNPQSGTWKNADTMKFARFSFIADMYNDNMIYCGGYIPGFGFHNALEVYDFHNSPSVHSSHTFFRRYYSAGVVKDSLLYVIGGFSLEPQQPFIVEYNLPGTSITYTNDSIYNVQNFPLDQMPLLVDNDIFVFGGVLNSVTNKIFRFNTVTKSYSLQSQRMIDLRAGGTVIKTPGNKAAIIGGYNETANAVSSTEIATIAGGTVVSLEAGPGMNFARSDLASVYFEGKIYVFGGTGANGEPVAHIETLEINPSTPVNDRTVVPEGMQLRNNYPNPFNAGTGISFSLDKPAQVNLLIYNTLGQLVRTLASGFMQEGVHEFYWGGDDDSGNMLSSGVYIYSLESDGIRFSKKMSMLK